MNGWDTRLLGDVLQLNYGKSLPVKNRTEGPVPVYGSNGVVGSHNKPTVDGPGLIVGRKGSAGQVHRSLGPFCPIDTTFYVTAGDTPDADLEFLYYLLLHIDLTRIVGDVGVPGLNREMAYLEKVSLPTALPEQEKIAYILSTVQRAIEAQERIIRITAELKNALMHKFFTEGLRNEPQKQTEIGPIPESWNVLELEKKAKSFQYGTSVKCTYGADGKPVLRIPNVVGGHVDVSDLKFGNPKQSELGKLVLQKGDLLFVRTNGVEENAGRCSQFNCEVDDCYFASYLIRVRLDPAILNSSFLSEYSRTETGVSFLRGRSVRTADGKFNINSGTLKTMLVPVPEIDEQEDIAQSLMLIDRKIEVARSKKKSLNNLFQALLHELMTAKSRVHELNLPKRKVKA